VGEEVSGEEEIGIVRVNPPLKSLPRIRRGGRGMF